MPGRGWAHEAHAALTAGRTVRVRPRGRSMVGRVGDGDLVTLVPCPPGRVAVGDVVLGRVRGHILVLHQVFDVGPAGFLIGTATGRVYGWVAAGDVFGRVVEVVPVAEPDS